MMLSSKKSFTMSESKQAIWLVLLTVLILSAYISLNSEFSNSSMADPFVQEFLSDGTEEEEEEEKDKELRLHEKMELDTKHKIVSKNNNNNNNKKNKRQQLVDAIHFLGERHSGTNWIYDHLVECFGYEMMPLRSLSRFKHWFQFENPKRIHAKRALILAQFRDPYDWVESMREIPHHAPVHVGLEWKDFVLKPWTMDRWGADLNITDMEGQICGQSFRYNEIIPCDMDLFWSHKTIYPTPPRYEMKHGGSGEPYESIVDLRADKIRNFLSTRHYEHVHDLWVLQYEELVENGTEPLLRRLEEVTGIKAKCEAFAPQQRKTKILDPKFVRWMNKYADWKAERMIGYERRH